MSRRIAVPSRLACLILAAAGFGGSAQGRCIDEAAAGESSQALASAPPARAEPRQVLQGLVRDALARSNAVGASRLLAEAAISEIDEARAAKGLYATVGAEVGPAVNRSAVGTTSGVQLRSTLSVSRLLYDGGRSDRLIDWRTLLAESARQGHLSQQEQIALNTVALAMERSRYRQQTIVYAQQVRKMACLVEALETIVQADRGRASELAQARKSLQQAEIAQAQTQSQGRQIDVRLRRLVGDGLPGVNGMASVLLQVPELALIEADVGRSTEIAQLTAQAAAMGQYAAAVAAGDRPQVSWSIGGSKTLATGGSVDNRSGSLGLGITVNVPLVNPGVAPAAEAARKRAQAALLQREEALEARRFRVREVHEQTLSAFDRAARVGAVLKDSDQVRNFTLQQWQQLGRRSLFDVMAAENDHYGLRVAYVNALHDGQQMNAILLSLGRGVSEWLR